MSTAFEHADVEDRIRQTLDAERSRLMARNGLVQLHQFKRPKERPFTASERGKVTILFGSLTWKHEAFIQAVFQGSGYACEPLPAPDVAAFQAGKEYGNNGQCNPNYFTAGNLVRRLQSLEKSGLTKQQIVDRYVFFTAGSCGPCRFGMYEAEYRYALQNAGFDGFRILLFQQQEGINAASGEAGLKFNVDFGLGMLNALHLGDVLNDIVYQIRPYEVIEGEADRVLEGVIADLATVLRTRTPFEIMEAAPGWSRGWLRNHDRLMRNLNTFGKIREHMYGKTIREALEDARTRLDAVEVDRFRVKPMVKITGEFWAQTTEGDGNFNIFRFLEREGAQVLVEPIATWVAYLLHQAKALARGKHDMETHHLRLKSHEVRKRIRHAMKLRKKLMGLSVGETLWGYFYHRRIRALGGITHHLVDQDELARLAHPFYHRLSRGGEGHLEIGKNIYYTVNNLAHMVLSLKPFGCMPSTQSDGAQSAVVNRYKDMLFLPIETSGEGEVNAHSRVQMALGEAKAKAKAEFNACVRKTGRTLDELRAYVDDHPEMKRPFYRVPHAKGVAGTAAQFALHAGDRMRGGA